MSKNQETPETPEEPDYEEPTYNTTLGKEQKEINDDALNKLMSQAKLNKKGKKNRKEHQQSSGNLEASSSQNLKKKKKVITDLNELKEINFANVPQRVITETKNDIEKYSQAQYQNTAILATVSGQIEESDISRFFNGLSIDKIHTEPGYYIIEFATEEDLRKALQKNKTPYTNNITVLVGEYSIEDENPKPEKHESRMYQTRNSYSRDFDEDDSYVPSGGAYKTPLSIGSRFQQPPESTSRYQPKKTSGFQIGGKFQQQGNDTNKAYQPRTPYSTAPVSKYTPSYAKDKNKDSKPFTVKNNTFGNLRDDDE